MFIKLHSILSYRFLSQLRNSLFCMTVVVGFFSVSGLFRTSPVNCNVVQDFLPYPDFSEAERAPVLFNQEINTYILHYTQF